MASEPKAAEGSGWLEASGLGHIVRTVGLAVHPPKVGLALLAIVATLLWGTLLDSLWGVGGGIDEASISRFIESRESDVGYASQTGESGIFAVWSRHQRSCVHGLLASSIPGASMASGTPVGTFLSAHSRARPLRNVVGMVYGVWWMARQHTIYFIIFTIGVLLIWSLAGGAICRLAAVQYTRDERLTAKQALAFAREKLISGFFAAPCIPLVFIFLGVLLLMIGGLILRIPLFGDLFGGVAFVFAIFGGFVLATLVLGLVVGGSLFWPAVAAEGSDAFDAFSRGLSYVFSKPWKTLLYAVIAVVWGGICWVFLNLFTYFALTITRACVGFGTSPFGTLSRGEEGQHIRKLDLLWPVASPDAMYAWPDWSRLAWYEYISAGLIAVFVLLVIATMWSLLASYYFSGSTVIYFLLRRDVDRTDLEDVYFTEADEEFRFEGATSPRSVDSVPAGASIPVDRGASDAGIHRPSPDGGSPEEPNREEPSSEDEQDKDQEAKKD